MHFFFLFVSLKISGLENWEMNNIWAFFSFYLINEKLWNLHVQALWWALRFRLLHEELNFCNKHIDTHTLPPPHSMCIYQLTKKQRKMSLPASTMLSVLQKSQIKIWGGRRRIFLKRGMQEVKVAWWEKPGIQTQQSPSPRSVSAE